MQTKQKTSNKKFISFYNDFFLSDIDNLINNPNVLYHILGVDNPS